jgi:hypothetical protein
VSGEREAILSRLETVLAAVPGIARFQRNSIDIPEGKVPCIVLLDGDEFADDRAFGRNRPPSAPNLVTMTPEVYVVLQDNPDEVGTELNTLRDAIISAIRTDATLLGLVHNRDIQYEGCQTALAAGRSMAGEMGLSFQLIYVHR